jgi:hypothetical protein
MDGKKVFIAVLILLVLAFIVLTVVGANRSSGQKPGGAVKLDPTQMAEQLGGIQDSLFPPPALSPLELRLDPTGSTSPDCVKLQSDLIVPQLQTCTFTVLPVEKNFLGIAPAVRKLGLTLTEGDGVSIVFKGKVQQDGGGGISTTADLALLPGIKGKPLDVYQAGGSLAITCQKSSAAPNCRLKLAK